MNLPVFFFIAAALMLARLAAQWWARGRSPAGTLGGRLSVWLWLLIYLALLAGAMLEVYRTGAVRPLGALVVLLSLVLRFAGLFALRGHYHEAIAVQESHGVVTSGVYRALRHPLHLALLGEMSGLALLSGEPWTLPCLLLTLIVLLQRNLQEEGAPHKRLGPPYREYLAGGAWDLVDLLPAVHRERGDEAAAHGR